MGQVNEKMEKRKKEVESQIREEFVLDLDGEGEVDGKVEDK